MIKKVTDLQKSSNFFLSHPVLILHRHVEATVVQNGKTPLLRRRWLLSADRWDSMICVFANTTNALSALMWNVTTLVNLLRVIAWSCKMSEASYTSTAVAAAAVNSSRYLGASSSSQPSVSSGSRISYNVGAWMMIPNVPTRQAAVNIHRNMRSKTIATNCQSCFTCKYSHPTA